MTFSQAVRRLREHAELSQKAFGRTTGLSLFSVQKFEAGRSLEPDGRSLVALMANALDQSRPDLAAFFEHALIDALALPPGWKITTSHSGVKRS